MMINDDNINKNSIPWDDPSWLDEEEKNQIKVTDINEQITETTEFVVNISVDLKEDPKSFHGDKVNERDHKDQIQMFNASDRHQDQLNVSDTQQINRKQNQNYFKKNYHNKETFPKNGKSDIMKKENSDNCNRNLKRKMEHDKYRKIDPDDAEVFSIDQMLNNIRIGTKNNNVEHELENKSLKEHENSQEVIDNTEICQESSLKKNSDEVHIEESIRSNNNTSKRQSIQVYNVNAVKGKWSNIISEKDSNDKSKCIPEMDKSCNNRGSDRSAVNQKDKLINDNLKMESRDTFIGGTRKPEYTNRLDKKDLNEKYFEKKVPLKFQIKFNEIDDFDKLINRNDGTKLISNDSQKLREERDNIKDTTDTPRPVNNNYKETNDNWKEFGNEKISQKSSYNQNDVDKDDLRAYESKTYYNKNYNEASDNYWKFSGQKDQTNNISGKSTQSYNNCLNKDCESKRFEKGEKDNQNFKREYNVFNNNRVPNMRNIRTGGNVHGGQNVDIKNITRSFCPTDDKSREYGTDNYGKKNTRDFMERNDRKQKEECSEYMKKGILSNENCKRNEDGRYNVRYDKDQKSYTKGNYRESESRNEYKRNETDRKQELRNQSDVRSNRFRRENISLKDSHDCYDNGGTPNYSYNNDIKNSVNKFNSSRNNIDDRRENRYAINEKDRFMRSKTDYNTKNNERNSEPDNFVPRNLDEKNIFNNDYKRFMGRKGNEESQINFSKCNKDQKYEPIQDRGKYNNREQIEADKEYKISIGRRKFNNEEDSSIRNRVNNQKFQHDSVKSYNRNCGRNQQPSNYNNNNTQNITKERSNRFQSEINPTKNS